MNTTRRGRPRQYDRETVLESAIGIFATQGYSGTSLDDLATAMGMNRPSIYNAFGDKEAVYRAALEHFVERLRREVGARVRAAPTLNKALRNLYLGALEVYFTDSPALGCFVFCTAPVEALEHPAVGTLMAAVINELDELLADRFREAQQAGSHIGDLDPRIAGKLAQAMLHSLAIRARAGESRASLERMARAAADTLAGTAP